MMYQFDTIYHEHLTCFSGITLTNLLQSNSFELQNIAKTQMHGGELRTVFKKFSHVLVTENMTRDPIGESDFTSAIDCCRQNFERFFENLACLMVTTRQAGRKFSIK